MKNPQHPISAKIQFTDLFPSNRGHIILDRVFLDWPLLHDAEAVQLFFALLMAANFKTKQFNNITIHRGEFMTSYAHLGSLLHRSRDQIKNTLAKLKRIKDVETVRVGNATLIKLINYNKYQALDKVGKSYSARPLPNQNPTSAPTLPTTKERKEGNNVIMQEEKEKRSVATFNQNSDDGGLKSIRAILARQGKSAKRKYDFEQLPPDWNELEAYVAEKNININLDGFYRYYENNGWCERNGKKLSGWHFALWHTHKTGEYL